LTFPGKTRNSSSVLTAKPTLCFSISFNQEPVTLRAVKIVIAPDSFKGSLTSIEAARAIEDGFRSVFPRSKCVCVPLADGGEGTVDAVLSATEGEKLRVKVNGPLGKPVEACFALLGETAVIEMAQAAGLSLVPAAERNPLRTSTFGVGQLVREAIHRGAKDIIIGIGGSATVDGGTGLAEALGVKFYGKTGLLTGMCGGKLPEIQTLDNSALDSLVRGINFKVACDVTNPLLGPTGAAKVYGPQKGATPEMVELLETGLGKLAQVIKSNLGIDVADTPGAGAAGGLGAGLMAFLGAEMVPGIELIMETVKLAEKLSGADLAISGEGRLDRQTAAGKVLKGVGGLCRKLNVPCVAIVGGLEPDFNLESLPGVKAIEAAVTTPVSLEQAMKEAFPRLKEAAVRAALWLKLGTEFKNPA